MCLPARAVLNTTTGRAANPRVRGREQPREPVGSSETLTGTEKICATAPSADGARRRPHDGRDTEQRVSGSPSASMERGRGWREAFAAHNADRMDSSRCVQDGTLWVGQCWVGAMAGQGTSTEEQGAPLASPAASVNRTRLQHDAHQYRDRVTGTDSQSETGGAPMNQTKAPRAVEGIEVPEPGDWQLDPVHTCLTFTARQLMVTKVHGKFTGVSGTIHLSENPAESSVEVEID